MNLRKFIRWALSKGAGGSGDAPLDHIWSKVKIILRRLVLLGTLGFIVHLFISNRGELAVLGRMPTHQVALLMLLQIAYLVVYGRRLQIVLEKCSEGKIGFSPWFRIFIVSRFLNTVVPQLGNVYRGMRLKTDHAVTYTRYVAGFVSFTWMAAWLNMVFALVVILSADAALSLGDLPAWQAVVALIVLLAAGPVAVDLIFRNITVKSRRLTWVHAKLSEVTSVSIDSLRDRPYVGKFLLLSLALFGMACGIVYLCFESLGIRIGLAQLALFYVLLQLTNYIVVTPGNIGVQEIAFGLLGANMGIGMPEGILVSALFRVTGYVALYGLAVPLGGVGVLRRSKIYRDGGTPNNSSGQRANADTKK